MGDETKMTVVEHLSELRWRLIKAGAAAVVGVGAAFQFHQRLLDLVIYPGEPYLDDGLIFISPPEAFLTLLKLSLVVGIMAASPVLLYQGLAYVWPALQQRERRLALWLTPVCVVLFAGGMVFAFTVIVPFALRFFTSFSTPEMAAMISLGRYVSFVIGVTLPFGVVFQLPVLVVLLTVLGIVSAAQLRRVRRFAYLVIVAAAAFITPPDVISQLLMAGPLVVLYEISLIVSAWTGRRLR